MNNNQQKVKAYELRKQDEVTLVQNLNKFRSELVGLRTSKVSSAPQVKLARIRVRICCKAFFSEFIYKFRINYYKSRFLWHTKTIQNLVCESESDLSNNWYDICKWMINTLLYGEYTSWHFFSFL